jgi:integrase
MIVEAVAACVQLHLRASREAGGRSPQHLHLRGIEKTQRGGLAKSAYRPPVVRSISSATSLQSRTIDDLHWHDLRYEGASRLLADGVDIRIIQLMLGHASLQQTQRYSNVTDEELRRGWR